MDRDAESRFYNTTIGTSQFHHVAITKNGIVGKIDSETPEVPIVLGETRERKTKRAREQKEHESVTAVAFEDECQKCHHQVKDGEDMSEWIQCENCVRSWHKTCVGIEAVTPLEDVSWSLCSSCGGSDPKGKMLVKRRKVACCPVCGARKRDLDHSACKVKKAEMAKKFITPRAQVIKERHPLTPRKKLDAPKAKRQARKKKKRKRKMKSEISNGDLQKLMKFL